MKLGKAKMWTSLVGGTATAVATAAATVSVAFEDNGLDVGEYGLIATALATLIATVRAVWAIENKPVPVESQLRRS
jgi:uncharacterized protein YabE (DUF348 family)